MRLLNDFNTLEEKEKFKKMVMKAFEEAKAKGETNLTIYKLVLDELNFFSCVKKENKPR